MILLYLPVYACMYTMQWKWEQRVSSLDDARHKLAFDIPARDLHNIYGYPADGPDLVLSTLESGNELRFAHDATWHLDSEDANNVKPWLAVVHHPTELAPGSTLRHLPVPLPMVYAEKAIKKGKEILMAWGQDMWETYQQIKVIKQGGANHQLHLRLLRFRQLLQHATSSDTDGQLPKRARQADSSAAAAVEQIADGAGTMVVGFDPDTCKWYFEGGADNSTAAGVSGAGAGTSKAIGSSADNGGTGGAGSSRGSGSSSAAQGQQQVQPAPRCWQQAPLLPEQVFRVLSDAEVVQIFPGLTPAWRDVHFSDLPEQLLEQFDELDIEDAVEGHRIEPEAIVRNLPAGSGIRRKVVVAEVLGLQHPVRWSSVPGEPAYTLLAGQDIEEDEEVIDYIGKYTLGDAGYDNPLDSAYVYGFNRDNLKQFGLNTRAADLQRGLNVDNKHCGNIARFINCCWGREEPAEGEAPHENMFAKVVWNKDIERPVVRLYASRRIERGDELVVSYGRQYWRIIARGLMMAQQQYAVQALLQEETLVKQLQQACRQGLLTQQQVDEVCSYEPDVHNIQLYTAE